MSSNQPVPVSPQAGQGSNLRGPVASGCLDSFAPRVDYDKFGQRLLLLNFGNGTRATYAYDPQTRRLTSVKAPPPTAAFHDLAFTFDAVGNLTQLQGLARLSHAVSG